MNPSRASKIVMIISILAIVILAAGCKSKQAAENIDTNKSPDVKIADTVKTPVKAAEKSTINTSITRVRPQNAGAIPNIYSYCTSLGYNYNKAGNCTFPDNSSCPLWQFYRGLCGQKFSYCERQGYDLKTVRDNMGTWTSEYSVCVFDDGSECPEEGYLYDDCKKSDCKKYLLSKGGCLN